MNNIGLLASFIAGFLTFFASCLVPVVPGYLGYLGAVTSRSGDDRRRVVINSLFFIFGFLLIFIFLALTATTFGKYLTAERRILEQIGGVFLIAIGVYMSETIKLPQLWRSWQFQPSQHLRARKLGSFIFGLTFGFAWTPCLGPVLAVILYTASQAQSQLQGIFLLLVFGLGLGLPFFLLALFFRSLQPYLLRVSHLSHVIRLISSAMIIIVGILMLTGHLGYLSAWALQWGGSAVLNFRG